MALILKKILTGTVYNSDSPTEGISGAYIQLIDSTLLKNQFVKTTPTYTNIQGKFELHIEYKEDTILDPTKITLKTSLDGFKVSEVTPLKGDGSFKENQLIDLQPIKTSIAKDKSSMLLLDENDIKSLTISKKDLNYFLQKRLSDSMNDIKAKIIPMVLDLAVKYGVTDIKSLLEKNPTDLEEYIKTLPCPPLDVIQKTITSKNKLVKKLNNLMKIIDGSSKTLGINEDILKILNVNLILLNNLPIPVAIAGVGIPMNVITNVQQVIKTLEFQLTKLSSVNSSTLVIVSLLKKYLSIAIKLLNILDQIIQNCYPDASQEQISKTLILNSAVISETIPTQSPSSVNGFIFGVETENTTKTLKRRRALAKNKGGTVLLSGEWSFSSIDQILIDELIFYIQQNNLKAD